MSKIRRLTASKTLALRNHRICHQSGITEQREIKDSSIDIIELGLESWTLKDRARYIFSINLYLLHKTIYLFYKVFLRLLQYLIFLNQIRLDNGQLFKKLVIIIFFSIYFLFYIIIKSLNTILEYIYAEILIIIILSIF